MKKELQDALELLYKTCYPLIWNDDKTEEQLKDRNKKITKMAFYCAYVETCLEHNEAVLSFDDWSNPKYDTNIDIMTGEKSKVKPSLPYQNIKSRLVKRKKT